MRIPFSVGLRGGSVKDAVLGDGAKPGDPLSAYEGEKSAIAKLPLDAATRMPGHFHGHTGGGLARRRTRFHNVHDVR